MHRDLTNYPQPCEALAHSSITFHVGAVTETRKLHIHPARSKHAKVLNQPLCKHPRAAGHNLTFPMNAHIGRCDVATPLPLEDFSVAVIMVQQRITAVPHPVKYTVSVVRLLCPTPRLIHTARPGLLSHAVPPHCVLSVLNVYGMFLGCVFFFAGF